MRVAASPPWCLYLLSCEGGRTYTGIALDPQRRLNLHASGNGSFFTRLNRPTGLLGQVWFEDHRTAAIMERRVKRLPLYRRIDWFNSMGSTSPTMPVTLASACLGLPPQEE